jgi:hypothetical protein
MSDRAPGPPRRRGTLDARVAWGLAIVAMCPIGFGLLSDPDAVLDPVTWLIVVLIGSLVVVGAIVASRVPDNRVGPLLLLAGLLTTLAVVLKAYEEVASTASPASPWTSFLLAVQDLAFWYPILVTLVAVPLVFPGSQAPSPRERIVGSALVTAVGTATVAYALSSPTVGSAGVENTLFTPGMVPVLERVIQLSLVIIFACAATAAWTLWQRFRGPDPVVRQQTKWLLATVAPAVVALVISQGPVPELVQTAGYFVALVATLVLPAAIGIAITRYHLYDIDKIVGRTVTYGVISALLAAMFLVTNVVLQALFERGTTFEVAVSTLVVAMLFQPLRRAIQRPIDRRFNRSHVDAERMIAAFAAGTRDEVDLERLAGETRRVATGAVEPVSTGLWLRGTAR